MGGRETEPDASGRIGRRRFRDGAFRLGVTAALQSLELSGPGSNPGGGAAKTRQRFCCSVRGARSWNEPEKLLLQTSHKEPPCQPLVSPLSSWLQGRAPA